MTIPSTLTAALVALTAGSLLTACTIGDATSSNDGSGTVVTVTREADGSESAPTPSANPTSATKESAISTPSESTLAALTGRTIYLDPGHAGTAPPAELTADDGRGGTKSCNTTGTASDDGWPEHTFTWEISQQLKSILEDAGAAVVLSRDDDAGRADCIDERTHKENASAADVVVSLHADGNETPGSQGFHISSVTEPLPQNLPDESSRLATSVRDAMVAAGLTPSTYLGTDGLYPRADLTGLNLSSKPKILIEFGNMRDATDISALRSRDGQQQRAHAVAQGVASYLS